MHAPAGTTRLVFDRRSPIEHRLDLRILRDVRASVRHRLQQNLSLALTGPRPLALLKARLSVVTLVRFLLEPSLIVGTLAVVVLLKGEPYEGPFLLLALFVFALTFPGSAHLHASWSALLRAVLMSWFLFSSSLLLIGYATDCLTVFPLRVMIDWFVATPFVVFAGHLMLRFGLPKVLTADSAQARVLIVGANEIGQRLAGTIRDNPLLGMRVIGFVDDRAADRLHVHADGVIGQFNELAQLVASYGVDRLYLALPMASQPRILFLLEDLRDTTVSIYFVPDIFVADLIQARVDEIGGIPVVAVCESPFYGVNGIVKRLSDFVFASIILILIAPLMLAIAIGVKLSSPGPVIFRQRRYGLDGKEIYIYKFRSMTVCEDGSNFSQARPRDPRVTGFGAFIRKYSMDELPQFINVLQGRMSVVGPRPHPVSLNEAYRKIIKGYMVRHKVKPGVTGWAQVNGLRGLTDTIEKMKSRVDYDLEVEDVVSRAGCADYRAYDLHRFDRTRCVLIVSLLPLRSASSSSRASWVAREMQFSARVVLASVIAASLAACGGSDEQKAPTPLAAKVNGKEITVRQIDTVLTRTTNLGPELEAGAKWWILDRLIDQQLARQRAIEKKLDREPSVAHAIEEAKSEILARAYLQQVTADIAAPTPEYLQQYYSQHPELFAERRIYSVEEIAAAASEGLLAALRERLSAGGSLESVADWLRERNIRFERNLRVAAAEQLPQSILAIVYRARDEDIQVAEGNGMLLVIRLVASRAAPIDQTSALAIAKRLLHDQLIREGAAREIQQLKARAKIEYGGEFVYRAPPGVLPDAVTARSVPASAN